MMTFYDTALVILAIVVVLLGIAVCLLARSHRRLQGQVHDAWRAVQKRIDATPAVVAHAVAERDTIAQWRAELAKHPEGSPKHSAYLNRLREVGAL